jgi:hypothetical protein
LPANTIPPRQLVTAGEPSMMDRPNAATPPDIGSVEEAHRALNDATILREDAEQYPHLHHATPEATLSYADDLEAAALAFLYPDDDTEGGSREFVPKSKASALAGKERLALASEARATELAFDMAESLEATSSAELALADQMAAAHALSLRLIGRANLEIEGLGRHNWQEKREAMVEIARLSNAATRLMQTYQQALVVLAKVRNGGKQTVIVQHVQVTDGGQAVIAGQAGGRVRGGRVRGAQP